MNTNAPTVIPQFLRPRIGKICVAIIGTSASEMLEKANAVVKEFPFLEFRLDYLEKPLLALPKLKQFLAENTAATAIATCRRTPNGGKFAGNAAAQVEVLTKAAASGFQIADLEIETVEELKKAELDKFRSTGIALIVSYHDFHATRDLDAVFERMRPFAPDFYKIVPTARRLADNVELLRFLERKQEYTNIIAICMGEAGIISRVLAVRAGSAFTFAAATPGEETGPGQIAARTLMETYRIDQVDTATKVYGVAGNPIRSSLSPIMLNTAFRRETVNAVYLALQTNELSDLLELVHAIPLQGLSVTMPLKQEILPHLERTDPLSARIGACNTVLRQDGKLYGFNTDVSGISLPLEKRMSLRGARVLVLGAGGAARAAVFGLVDKGAEVFLLNRTPETAQKLAKQAGAKVIKKEAVAKSTFDAVVNATPIGMAGNKAPQMLDAKDLANVKLVFDLVYNPLETPLIRMARQLNIPIITGVEMFVQQGARQFEIFTGKPAPEEEMLRVVIHALRQQAEATAEAAPRPMRPATPSKATPSKASPTQETPAAAPKSPTKAAGKAPVKAATKVVAKTPAKAAAKPATKSAAKPAAKTVAKSPSKPAAKPKKK
ncbi:MAG: shikimate dehydrogenase [Acidobacteriota bacterium]|nr:shikimate dehydrogenase [Acidobacteriota bacterium]